MEPGSDLWGAREGKKKHFSSSTQGKVELERHGKVKKGWMVLAGPLIPPTYAN